MITHDAAMLWPPGIIIPGESRDHAGHVSGGIRGRADSAGAGAGGIVTQYVTFSAGGEGIK